MDPVDSGNRSAAQPGARPSLFVTGQSASTTPKQPEAISILSSLDKTGGKKPLTSHTGLPTWFAITAGSLLGITIAAAIVMSLTRDTGIGPVPGKPMELARAAAPARVAEAPVMPVPSASTSDISAGATIENAPPAAIAPAHLEAAGASSITGPAKTSTIAATEPAAPAAEAAPPVPRKPSADTRIEAKAEKSSAGPKSKPKDSKSQTGTAASSDRDASLLAALVAYGEGKPATDINANAAAMTSQPANPKTAGSSPPVALAGQFDPKRDVVMRTSNVSTAELVRRCRTLGFFEGLLCRTRVCSNLWGKDPACPQSSAPPPTAPVAQ